MFGGGAVLVPQVVEIIGAVVCGSDPLVLRTRGASRPWGGGLALNLKETTMADEFDDKSIDRLELVALWMQ